MTIKKTIPLLPKLSKSLHVLSLLLITIGTILVINFKIHRTIQEESFISGICLFSIFFFYFTIILYYGLRYDKGIDEKDFYNKAYSNFKESVSIQNIELPSLPSLDFDTDIFSIFFSLIHVLFFIIGMGLLAWVGVNILFFTFISIAVPFYYIFCMSIRLVIVKGNRCKKNLAKTIFVSSQYSFFYALIISGSVFLTELIWNTLT